MAYQQINFVDHVITNVYHVPPWWDKWRWKLVRLLGGMSPFDSVKVTRIAFDDRDFTANLWKQKRALFDSFRREPALLLIGAEDFEELMSQPAITQAFTFNANFNYGRYEVYGLTVKVIPWMRGTLVMPQDNVEAK